MLLGFAATSFTGPAATSLAVFVLPLDFFFDFLLMLLKFLHSSLSLHYKKYGVHVERVKVATSYWNVNNIMVVCVFFLECVAGINQKTGSHNISCSVSENIGYEKRICINAYISKDAGVYLCSIAGISMTTVIVTFILIVIREGIGVWG